jgi:A118 family predicted phage portal protein
MFERILSWIKDWVKRMLGKQSVDKAMNVTVALSKDMATAIDLWTRMYENDAPWLNSSLYSRGNEDVYSMNLASAIAGEVARSVTIEMEADFSGSARATWLEEQFARVMDKLRHQVEFGCAKGGLVFKPYIKDDQLAIDYVHADQFYPVAFDTDGNITSIVFVDQRRKGDNWYTRLEYHNMTEQGCEIVNQAYKSSNQDTLGQKITLASIDDWAEIEEEATITGIDKPLYAYFRYPLANNIDSDSPLGVSSYSRATDLIRQADLQWSNLLWEFEAGQTAIFIDELAFGRDSDGKVTLPHKRLYRALETGSVENNLFEGWSPTLREENILRGLDAILKRIEYTCGLAYGTLSDPQTVDKTATEIKISRQRTFSTIVDTQKSLEQALDQLLWAMDVWATIGGLAPQGNYEVAFQFDDSVIVDKDTQFQQDLRLVSQGLMSKVEFRMRNFGESEELAKAALAEVEAERQPMLEIPNEE